jgi:hypothetical protein
MKKIILFSSIVLIFAQCKPDDTSRQMLIGNWNLAAWMEAGRPKLVKADLIQFEFKADNSYIAMKGDQKEAGNFRLDRNKLYTTDTLNADKIEKMVLLSRISTDTLYVDMNRQGTSEKLILVKIKK